MAVVRPTHELQKTQQREVPVLDLEDKILELGTGDGMDSEPCTIRVHQ